MNRFLAVRAVPLLMAVLLVLSSGVLAQSSKFSGKTPEQSAKALIISQENAARPSSWNAHMSTYGGDNIQSFVFQDFEGATFPPTGWTLQFTGTQYWNRYSGASGYGSGTASAQFNFFNSSTGTTQSLVSPLLTPAVAGDSVKFDEAYASYSGEVDSLSVETSIDGGTTFIQLVGLAGGASGPLVTAPPQTAVFVPTAAQWKTFRYALPPGTNMVRFMAVSAFGNDMYVDNIALGTPASHDVAALLLEDPANGATKTPSVPFSPVAVFKNMGGATEGPFNVQYQILNSVLAIVYTNTQSVATLVPGDTAQVTFASVSGGLPAGAYTIRAISQLAGDLNPANDSLAGGLSVAFSFCDTYQFAPSAGSFTPLTGSTAPPLSGGSLDDGYYNGIPIGFNFTYYGLTYTTVGASTNGWLSLTGAATTALTNDLTTGGTRPVLAPLWDDLQMAVGVFSYKTEGSPGSQIFTAEWLNAQWNYSVATAVISFQVKLYEANGRIEFIYRQEATAPSSASASIGVTSTPTGSGNFISLDGTGASPNPSCTTETITLNAAPATGQIYAFFPGSLVANDIGAVAVNDPASGQAKRLNQAFSPKATFRNAGTSTQTSIPVRLKIFDGTSTLVYSNNQTIASLTPFASLQVTFSSFTPSTTGSYIARAIALNPGDLNGSNDSVSVPFTVVDVPQFLVRPDSLTKTVAPGTRDSVLFYMRNAGGVSGNFSAGAIMYPRTSPNGPVLGPPVVIPMTVTRVAAPPRPLPPGDAWGVAPDSRPVTKADLNEMRRVLSGVNALAINPNSPITEFKFDLSAPGTLIAGPTTIQTFAACFDPTQSFLYAVQESPSQLVRIDTGTGATVVIGGNAITDVWTALRIDRTSGIAYATTTSGTTSSLYTIDLTTGALTLVGTITGVPVIIAMAIDASGQMYAYDIDNGGTLNSKFYSIDKATGAPTLIGDMGFIGRFAQDMAFDPSSGVLYAAAYNFTFGGAELRTINVTTGSTTLIGPLGAGTGVQLDAFDIGRSTAPWLFVTPTSGTVAVGDSVLMKAYFDARDTSISNHLGNYYGRIEVTPSGAPLADLLEIPARMTVGGGSSTVNINTSIANGWNMISNPVTGAVPDDSSKHLFPTIISRAFEFVPGGGYQGRDTMGNRKGYWGKFPGATTNVVTGFPLTRDTISVVAGWNMVGSISNTVDTATIGQIPAGIKASNWFGFVAGYAATSPIVPGKAYWVKVNANGKFVFANPLGAAPAKARAGSVSPLDALNTLTITDSRGGSQTLYFGADAKNEIRLPLFDMPPAPPVGVLDARFETASGGSMVQTHALRVSDPVSFPVKIQSDAYPVTVTWKINGGTASYQMTDGVGGRVFRAKEMTAEGSIKIINSDVNRVVVNLVGDGTLPAEYALSQNYPNPFNPTTSIKYALPVQSRVTMQIYNVLGQNVRTLVNDDMPAGYQAVVWDGTGNRGQQLASGTYFLQLSAQGTNGKTFNEIRKLLLLK